MQTKLIDLKKDISFPDIVETCLCFDFFTRDIQRRLDFEQTIKADFYRFLLAKVSAYPDFNQPIEPHAAFKYKNIFELVYTALSATIDDEKKHYWALATPVPDKIIYSTEAFYNFMTDDSCDIISSLQNDPEQFKKRQIEFVYRVILEKLYHFPSYLRTDTIYQKQDADTGLPKYYRIHTNTNYVNVKVKGQLPELNPELIEYYLYEGAGADSLEKIIPLSLFSLEGFSIITIEDYTAQQAIENIRKVLADHSFGQKETYEHVIQSLQTLALDADIDFGLLPFLKVNGKLIFNTNECYNSIITKSAKNAGIAEEAFYSLVNTYLDQPKAIFFSTITNEKKERHFFLKALSDAGIQSYAVLPVYYNQRLSGIMEIYSRKRILFYETLLLKLETVIPLLAQLLQESIERFNLQIDNVIKDKFTMLQPTVEWKFNEAAWNYIKQNTADKGGAEIATVAFNEVFPLYGAIDIRNSTIERDSAMHNDARLLKQVLSETLTSLKDSLPEEANTRFTQLCESWMPKVDEIIVANDEKTLKSFFYTVVNPVMMHLKDNHPEVKGLLGTYETVVNEWQGEGYKHRRALDHSVKLINDALNTYLQNAQRELLNIYPCYFEKFRTDGVEYDIFTGQSLAPHLPFTMQALKDFRCWQLQSMINIACLTQSLLPAMSLQLQTTQLIFIHANPIDITFRLDERRFDVEGAYNIRYEIIKKRIDKVLIKGTQQRLTQPGKIAMVYFNDQEAVEYKEYIALFQKQGRLSQKIEYLELDDLQGVYGLKALRVSINF